MRYYQDRFKNFYATALGEIARRGLIIMVPLARRRLFIKVIISLMEK
jgi:hypothetical protein